MKNYQRTEISKKANKSEHKRTKANRKKNMREHSVKKKMKICNENQELESQSRTQNMFLLKIPLLTGNEQCFLEQKKTEIKTKDLLKLLLFEWCKWLSRICSQLMLACWWSQSSLSRTFLEKWLRAGWLWWLFSWRKGAESKSNNKIYLFAELFRTIILF